MANPDGDTVQAFILLGGGLTPSPLTAETRCSVLDLLVGPGEATVLDRWISQIDALGPLAGSDIEMIIANGGGNPIPNLGGKQITHRVRVVVDKHDYRGAAGVVCDVSSHLSDGALLLVVEAARCPDFDLAATVRRHRGSGCAATVLVNPDDTPAGVYLMTRHLLQYVQREGYMDLKEQWLNKVIGSNHRIGVHRLANGYSRPLRSREQLLRAAIAAESKHDLKQSPFRFRISTPTRPDEGFHRVSQHAQVDESAVVIDSIIMPGASIGAFSVIMRSIICADCHIPADAMLIDTIVGPSDTMHKRLSTDKDLRELRS